MMNNLLFVVWIVLIGGVFYFLKIAKVLKRRVLVVFLISTLLLGSILLYIAISFNEMDIAWYALFYFPVFYFYSLLNLIMLIRFKRTR